MRSRRYHGIVCDAEGHYVHARMVHRSALWAPVGITRAGRQNSLARFLLMHRGVYLGLHTSWKKSTSFLQNPALEEFPTHELFTLCAATSELNLHNSVLAANLCGTVSDDTFLATLPLLCSERPTDSFVSIFAETGHFLIGVIINRRLVITWRMTPMESDNLAGYLGRIERHWSIQNTEVPFPSVVYTLGRHDFIPATIFATPPIQVSLGELIDHDTAALQACGVALAQVEPVIPLLRPATAASGFRKIRALMYYLSVLTLTLAFLVVGASGLLNWWSSKTHDRMKQQYLHEIANNTELTGLETSCMRLAERVSDLKRHFTKRTSWARFLAAVGQARPSELYLDRMGSVEDEQKSGPVRIALTGWTTNKQKITSYISMLQENQFLSNIKLVSMEQDRKHENIVRFKIVCTLKLIRD